MTTPARDTERAPAPKVSELVKVQLDQSHEHNGIPQKAGAIIEVYPEQVARLEAEKIGHRAR